MKRVALARPGAPAHVPPSPFVPPPRPNRPGPRTPYTTAAALRSSPLSLPPSAWLPAVETMASRCGLAYRMSPQFGVRRRAHRAWLPATAAIFRSVYYIWPRVDQTLPADGPAYRVVGAGQIPGFGKSQSPPADLHFPPRWRRNTMARCSNHLGNCQSRYRRGIDKQNTKGGHKAHRGGGERQSGGRGGGGPGGGWGDTSLSVSACSWLCANRPCLSRPASSIWFARSPMVWRITGLFMSADPRPTEKIFGELDKLNRRRP